LVGTLLLSLLSGPAAAQDSPFQALAEHLTARGPYRGPIVALDGGPALATDAEQIRPARGEVVWCALERPLCVHGARQDAARAPQVLAALGRAYDWLLLSGWPLPYSDGGAGGTLEHDVYLVAGAQRAAVAYPEQLASATPLDSASSFALLDRSLPEQALSACALAALTEAGLLARDPAEAPQLREASAAVAVWLAEGTWGCELDAEQAQREPRLGSLGAEPAQIAAAAQWLAWLDLRHHGGSGELVRGLWELAAQRSDGPSKLHARPTLWEALERVLERAGETLDADAEELAMQRALAPEALGLGLGALTRVTLLAEGTLAKLPFAVGSREPLASYGSAYVRIEAPAVRPDRPLRVWLRAEPDARWSLLATRLDERGQSLGTIAAPPRKLPESFLPIELTPDTRAVLIAVTALPLQRPEERAAFDEHHFRIIVAHPE